MSGDEMFLYSWLSRISERLILSSIVITISIILIIAFWKSLQKIDFDIKSESNSIRANMVFATPIFVLLILVCFSLISFSHPILMQENIEKVDNSDKKIEKKYSFFGITQKDTLKRTIEDIRKANQKITDYNAGQDKVNVDLLQSSALLKSAITSIVINHYGQDLVSGCRTKESSEYNDTECMQIREMLQ